VQVLSVVKKKIEVHASSVDKFGQLLDEAKQFFMFREQCFVTKKPWTEITTMGLGSPAADAPSPVAKGLFGCICSMSIHIITSCASIKV
jgi:hypothetical protein